MRIVIGLLLAAMAGPAIQPEAAKSQAGAAPSGAADWMSKEDGVLELKLAHEEKARPDGGTLRVDEGRQLLLWEGIPGEFGCKLKIEASFEDVGNISVSEQAGFVVEFKRGKTKKLVLIPVPHAWWFQQQWGTRDGNFGQGAQGGTMRGPDGDSVGAGGAAAGAGPRLKHRGIPEDVAAATLKAANAVRAALGRGLLH